MTGTRHDRRRIQLAAVRAQKCRSAAFGTGRFFECYGTAALMAGIIESHGDSQRTACVVNGDFVVGVCVVAPEVPVGYRVELDGGAENSSRVVYRDAPVLVDVGADAAIIGIFGKFIFRRAVCRKGSERCRYY